MVTFLNSLMRISRLVIGIEWSRFKPDLSIS